MKGHSQGVRDITFNNNGSQFLSSGYDKGLRLWDAETGQCIRKFNSRRVVYCMKFHPSEAMGVRIAFLVAYVQHLFITGTQDKKILGWDSRTGNVIQEYDRFDPLVWC